MTEKEAFSKDCIGPETCGRINYDSGSLRKPRLCIGSACMAWRTNGESYDQSGAITARYGYCGLAGEPSLLRGFGE